MNAQEIGKELCKLVGEGRHLDAIDRFYADDIVSVEAAEGQGMPRRTEGKQQVRGKTEWWSANHDVDRNEVKGPFPHGENRFAAVYDVGGIAKDSGERFDMTEVAVYTVEDGMITHEEFYYG